MNVSKVKVLFHVVCTAFLNVYLCFAVCVCVCVLLHGTACPGAPEAPTLDSSVPPTIALSWTSPTSNGAWIFTYQGSWTNESIVIPRQASTTAQIPELQAETQYTVVITAFPVSILCPNQSTAFTFRTSQS